MKTKHPSNHPFHFTRNQSVNTRAATGRCGSAQEHFPVGMAMAARGPLLLFAVAAAAMCFAVLPPCRAENMIYPAGSTVINITNAPYNARGDGVTDCTTAIQKAMDDYTGHAVMIYFPNGTYLVSASLVWKNKDSGNNTAWGNTFIQGQSKAGTLIKLKNGTFTNPGSPKAIMSCVGFGSADWFANYVQNITFDTGTNNTGAIGLQFYSNNYGAIRDVKIISGDGQGVTGLDLSANMNGPLLVKNLTVQGFQTGINCGNAVNSQTFEHITLTGQTSCAFNNSGQTIAIRDLTFSGAAPAVQTSGGLLSLIDANLTRTSGSGTAITCSSGYLHVRNLTTSGYSQAITCTGDPNPGATGPNVTEFFSHNQTSPFPSPTNSLNLPIQETPDVAWDDPSTWANVNDYGADPNGVNDSKAAIQAAIDSGATTIWFPGKYACNSAVFVRNNAPPLICVGGFVDYNGDTGIDFIVTNGTSPTVVIEHFAQIGGGIRIETSRNVVIRSCNPDNIFVNNASANLYLEDTCYGWLVPNLTLKGNVWARQLNPEVEGNKVLNMGGNLWVLGLKTERSGTLVDTRNGGKSEILGDFSYTTTHVTPGAMFVNSNASMFTEFTEVCYSGQPFDNIIQETRGSQTITVSRTQGWVAPYIGYTNSGGSAPVANFTGNPTSGNPPLTVFFTDNSTGSPTSWSWTFGDGGTSIAQNPSHQYTSAGSYTVALTVTNAYGKNAKTNANYITVIAPQPPVANFSGTPTNGTAPLTVNFTDSSTGSPTFWSWTFGDGGTSTQQNPSHQYLTAGNYTVALTVTNANGSSTNTKPNYITVTAPPPPAANFSGTPTNGSVPLTVNFTDSSTGNPTSWSWTFGDGGTSTQQNPSHQYTNTGTYTVALTVTNVTGNSTMTKTNYITVQAASMPTFVAAGAIASGTGAITPALPSGIAANDILLLFLETANQAISIANQNGGTWAAVAGSPQGTGTAGGSSATELTVFWSRYNGTQGAPTTSDSGNHQQGRILAFRGCATSGNPWDVTAGGTDSGVTTSGSIPGATTTVGNCRVVAAIATSLPDASGTANFSAWANANLTSVTERTDNTVTAGNGGGLGTATGGKAGAGAYGSTTVTLATASTKAMMSIALKPGGGGGSPPVANFSGTPTSGAAPLTVNFTDSSTGSPTSWSWTFGDGGTSTSQNPSHQYTSAGNYTVALTAANAYGSNTNTKTSYITVTNSGGGGLPAPWQQTDVGSVGTAGSASYSSGTFTVSGAGSDMWGTADSFHFVYQLMTNNCTVIARVATQQNTASVAKAGVVIRQDLTAGSISAYMVVTPSDGDAFGWRTTTGGSTTDANSGRSGAPYWVKLVRSGNSFSAYESANGSTWTQVGSTQTISMAGTTYAGLCVCSAANPTLGTDTFDNVTVTSP